MSNAYPWIEDGPRNGPKTLPGLNGFSIIRREASPFQGTYDLRWAWFKNQEEAERRLHEVGKASRHLVERLSVLRDPDGAVIHLAEILRSVQAAS